MAEKTSSHFNQRQRDGNDKYFIYLFSGQIVMYFKYSVHVCRLYIDVCIHFMVKSFNSVK